MALISDFVSHDRERPKVHDRIDAQISSFDAGEAGHIVQIDTLGRRTRENPGKVSQSLQLDRKSAEALYLILKAEFGFT